MLGSGRIRNTSTPVLYLVLLIAFSQLGLRIFHQCDSGPSEISVQKKYVNTFSRNGSKHSATPFLVYPRGRLPLFIIVNLLAGDINLSPGPKRQHRGRKPKYPCGLCSFAVKDSGIQCSMCTSWFHLNCSNVSNDIFGFHSKNPNAIWLCPLCDVINLASSFFDSSSDLTSMLNLSNSFESLTSLSDDPDCNVWNHENLRSSSPICVSHLPKITLPKLLLGGLVERHPKQHPHPKQKKPSAEMCEDKGWLDRCWERW